MKIKIMIEEKEREVIISGLKRKHKKAWMDKVNNLAKEFKEDNIAVIGNLGDFLDFQDDFIIEHSDLTKEEYDDLDLEEANKIILAVRKVLFPEGDNIFF